MALVWVAVAPIWNGQFRAFNPGDVVPDSLEARWDYSGQGLVVRQESDDAEWPDQDTGVALRSEVVSKDQLWIGPTPPETPAPGSVWIDTSP